MVRSCSNSRPCSFPNPQPKTLVQTRDWSPIVVYLRYIEGVHHALPFETLVQASEIEATSPFFSLSITYTFQVLPLLRTRYSCFLNRSYTYTPCINHRYCLLIAVDVWNPGSAWNWCYGTIVLTWLLFFIFNFWLIALWLSLLSQCIVVWCEKLNTEQT